MSTFFTSDLHLGHFKVIEMCGRNKESCGQDFENIEQMNEYLINKWNNKVTDEDTVYILGDLSFKSAISVKDYLKQLKGHKHLIMGNHDYNWLKNVPDITDYVDSCSHMEVINIDKKVVTLSHYPMLEWNGSRRATNQDSSLSWLIHGHIHNSRECKSYEYIKKNLPCALNAGVDINGYEPVTFEELIENNNRWYKRG